MKFKLLLLSFFIHLQLNSQNTISNLGNGILPSNYVVNNLFSLDNLSVYFTACKADGNGTIYFANSNDGGTNWEVNIIDQLIYGISIDLFVLPSKIAYVSIEDANTGDIYWYKSNGNYNQWTKIKQNTYSNLIYMYDELNGTMIGGGAGFHTSDSFNTLNTVDWSSPGGPPKLFSYNFFSGTQAKCKTDSGIYFIYPKGHIVRTQDKGKTWQGIATNLNQTNSTSSITINQNNLMVFQKKSNQISQGLAHSSDFGKTWTNASMNLPNNCNYIQTICAYEGKENSFLLCDFEQGIYESNDNGLTWQKFNLINENPNFSGLINMTSDNVIWVGLTTTNNNSPSLLKIDLMKASISKTNIPNINFYPNPCFNTINIELKNLKSVTITDLFGKSILNKTTTNDIETIQIDSLNSGLYLLQISDGDNTYVKKFEKTDL